MSQQSSPQALIERLREATSRGDWDAIDPILGDINRDFKPELVAPLLSTLVDNKLFEEPMFGIVHLAETAQGPDFVHGLLAALPKLSTRSPRWTRTLLGRVFNSSSTFQELLDAVDHASREQIEALDTALPSLEERNPERFGPGAAQVRARIRKR